MRQAKTLYDIDKNGDRITIYYDLIQETEESPLLSYITDAKTPTEDGDYMKQLKEANQYNNNLEKIVEKMTHFGVRKDSDKYFFIDTDDSRNFGEKCVALTQFITIISNVVANGDFQ